MFGIWADACVCVRHSVSRIVDEQKKTERNEMIRRCNESQRIRWYRGSIN